MMTSDDLEHRLIREAHDLSQILERCADGGYTLDRMKAECGDAVVMLSRLTTFIGSFRPAREQGDVAWLVELPQYRSPTYFAGVSRDVEAHPFVLVTSDHLKAIRFARKEDAEQLIKSIGRMAPFSGQEDCFRAVEHAWTMEIVRDSGATRDYRLRDLKRAERETGYSVAAIGGAAKSSDLSAPDMRESLRRAYEQGCLDTHKHWRPDRDPDFTEAAYDYADAFLAASTGSGDGR